MKSGDVVGFVVLRWLSASEVWLAEDSTAYADVDDAMAAAEKAAGKDHRGGTYRLGHIMLGAKSWTGVDHYADPTC